MRGPCRGRPRDPGRFWANAVFILAFLELVKKQVDNGVAAAYSCSLRSQNIYAFILRSAARALEGLGHFPI